MYPPRTTRLSLICLTLLSLACSSPSELRTGDAIKYKDVSLASINGKTLSVEEFKEQFARSNGNLGVITDTLASYEDFLTRYVDFRIKVLEAKHAGYDSDESMVQEIGQYRSQLARPYLMERNVFEPLVRQMYERRLFAVKASHVLLAVAESALPHDTLAAYNRLSAIRDSILAGSDFGDMAAAHSTDPSAKGPPGSPGYEGSLGYFGGGRMVKEFEDAAYSTALGDVSDIFRTQFGYHILQTEDRIEMPADRELAHIMLRARGTNAADVADLDERISRVGTLLQEGDQFEEVARDLSDDQNSAELGGAIGTLSFDAGLPDSFREAAFGIENIGDYVGPITTPFGQHYIKFLGESALGSYDDEYDALKTRVSSMPRAASAERAFARMARADLSVWLDTARVQMWAGTMSADSLYRSLSSGSLLGEDSASVFLRFEQDEMTLSEFATYFSSGRLPDGSGIVNRIFAVADRYLDDQAIEYEVEMLENRDVEFSRTMQDFRDGLILFRLMEDSVWTAASVDSAGIETYFLANQDQFQYPERIQVISHSSASKSGMSAFLDVARTEGVPSAVAFQEADSTFSIHSDTTFVFEETGSIFDQILTAEEGTITEPITYNRGYISLQHAGIQEKRAMTLEEARSEVISRYQEVIESNLIERLRTKYRVSVRPQNLRFVTISTDEE